MNASTIYDKSVKLIDDSYNRLLKIWELPKGSLSKKTINNHTYYYHQYRDGKKIISKIVKDSDLMLLRKQINERKRLEKLNKNVRKEIERNIRVVKLFDKGLSASLLDEMYAFSFDEIPFNERTKVSFPFIDVVTTHGSTTLSSNDKLKEYFINWQKGIVRAREMGNYIIKKISD